MAVRNIAPGLAIPFLDLNFRSPITLSSRCLLKHAFLLVPATAFLLSVGLPSSSFAAEPAPTATAEAGKPPSKCEHGVKKAICTRCNPKLAAVFKAKGDWCAEHDRPESQCSLCHPDLAKEGVK